MLEFLKPFWIAIAKWIVLAAGAVAFILKMRQDGKDSQKAEDVEQTLKGVQIRDTVEQNINNASTAERQRLREKWNRSE